MKTIMFKNGKGGDGKTSSTIIMASLFAESHRVIVVDTDVRHHLTDFFTKDNSVPVTGTIGEWMLHKKSYDDVIIRTNFKNIDLVCCGEDINEEMRELEKNIFESPQSRLRNKLAEIDDRYDYCIIDCSQNADGMALNTFIASDLVMIPTRASESSLSGVKEMIGWIQQITQGSTSPNPKLDYMVFISDKERNKEAEATMIDIKSLVSEHFCDSVIRHQSKPLSRSWKTGLPIVYESSQTPIAEDYRRLYEEVKKYGI